MSHQNTPLKLGESPATLDHYIREFIRNNIKVELDSDTEYYEDGPYTSYTASLFLKESNGNWSKLYNL